MAAFGRVRPNNPLNSWPETCRSSWAAIQLTFVYTGSRPTGVVLQPDSLPRSCQLNAANTDPQGGPASEAMGQHAAHIAIAVPGTV